MKKPKLGFKDLFPILFILFFGGIGVQTLISCSSDDDATMMSTAMPIAPLGVTAIANSVDDITVGWGFVMGATGYYIFRSTSTAGIYTLIGYSMATSYTDNSLSPGTTYYYRVAAYDGENIGSQSGFASATTKPNTPTGVTATANSTSSITVSWRSVTGATMYYIYRSATADGTYTQVGTSATTLYINTGLSPGTRYYYRVAAYNGGGISSQSGFDSAKTEDSL